MMRITGLLTGLLAAGALFSGCGSSEPDDETTTSRSSSASSSASPSGSTTTSASPAQDAGYLALDDSKGINAAIGLAYDDGRKAADRKAQKHCDRVGTTQGYKQWRACWHALLDPLRTHLTLIGTEFGKLSMQDGVRDECVTALEDEAGRFSGFADRVGEVLAGIDSDVRQKQAKALKSYDSVLGAAFTGLTAPLKALTAACYSPEVLASVNASPSPSPTG